MKCLGSECSFCLFVLRYIIAVYILTEKTVFISGFSQWPSWEISIQYWYWLALKVTYHVLLLWHVSLYCNNAKCSCVFHVSFSWKLQTKVAPSVFSVLRFIVACDEIWLLAFAPFMFVVTFEEVWCLFLVLLSFLRDSSAAWETKGWSARVSFWNRRYVFTDYASVTSYERMFGIFLSGLLFVLRAGIAQSV
jgi:hypothetical protein